MNILKHRNPLALRPTPFGGAWQAQDERIWKRMLHGLVVVGSVLTLTTGQAFAVGEAAGLTVPTADPALSFIAPSPDQPNYAARLQVFLQATVPDTWNGQPVQFLSTFNEAGGTDALGLPTSAPMADPNNPNFLYQRFENGILFYNASEGSTTLMSLA